MNIGSFKILATLGSGAHSTILQIRRNNDPRNYALKVVNIEDPEEDMKFKDQAEHEFEVLQKLDHANIIKAYAFELIKDWLFRVKKVHLMVEFIPGKTLDVVKGLTTAKTLQVFRKVAMGMVHMHRREVCHGDLKPNNIMLAPGGIVKIIDFGLARCAGQAKNRIQGTPEYIAPETVKLQQVTERSDIYNFGATMYRMFTWKLPPPVISGDSGGAIDPKIWQKHFKPVCELNPAAPVRLGKLIETCMNYNAMQRPERFGEILSELEEISAELGSDPTDTLENMETV